MAGGYPLFETADPERRITLGNRVRHLTEDDHTVRTLWRAIDEAHDRIWLSMYTLKPDDVGLGTLERLTAAARRGCEVKVLYDDYGSWGLELSHTAPLQAAGGRVAVFHPVWPPWRWRGRPDIRNHRKLLFIDDDVAFCGGLNLSVHYAGTDLGQATFDDTMVRLEGPCVHDLMQTFCRSWQWTAGEACAAPSAVGPFEDGALVEIMETDPRRPATRMRQVLARALAGARSSIRITTPYFVPQKWLTRAVYAAVQNGVEVRVITAGRTDSRVARQAARSFYPDLLRHGVRVYEMQDRIIHTKKVTIDDSLCAIGSYNFDAWTSRHVLDAGLLVLDTDLAVSFCHEFDEDLERCREITDDEIADRRPWVRLGQWGARRVYHLM